MTAQYDEFFVTPEGEIDARKVLPKWKVQNVIETRADEITDKELRALEPRDRKSLKLWFDVMQFAGPFYPRVQAYVFGVGSKRGSGVDIRIGIPADLDPTKLTVPTVRGRHSKRWAAPKPARDLQEVLTSIMSILETRGFPVGGGYQVKYHPITVFVRRPQDAKTFIEELPRVLEMHGLSMDDLHPLPAWRS